jgi:hypothetical protein
MNYADFTHDDGNRRRWIAFDVCHRFEICFRSFRFIPVFREFETAALVRQGVERPYLGVDARVCAGVDPVAFRIDAVCSVSRFG